MVVMKYPRPTLRSCGSNQVVSSGDTPLAAQLTRGRNRRRLADGSLPPNSATAAASSESSVT